MKTLGLAIDTAGLHPSTEACLEALQWLHERRECAKILDMGCGNGILAAVSAHIWDARVLAADISPKAVEAARQTIAEYGLENRVQAVRSDGFSAPEIAQNGPFDLIIANILAETHVRLAQDVKKHLSSDGCLIISGILAWLAPDVESAFTGLGFEILKQIDYSPWRCTVLCHTTAT